MRKVIVLGFLLVLEGLGAYAQSGTGLNIAGKRDDFCKRLDQVMEAADDHFSNVIDFQKDSFGFRDPYGNPVTTRMKNTVADSSGIGWRVRPDLKLEQARECRVIHEGGAYRFEAVFLARDEKEQLAASYNNLLNQVKDCYPEVFTFTAKKSHNYNVVYETEAAPNLTLPGAPNARIRIFIQRNWNTMLYELVLEIKPVKF
jgi:hypothetical protein